MMNIDYLKDIDPVLKPLYELCNVAEVNQQTHSDMSAIYTQRALEWITKAIYQLKNIQMSDRTSLLTPVTGAPFIEFVANDRREM